MRNYVCELTPGCTNRRKHDDPDDCTRRFEYIKWEIALLIGALIMGA